MRSHNQCCTAHRLNQEYSNNRPRNLMRSSFSGMRNSVSLKVSHLSWWYSSSCAYHQYKPPDVGIADPRSAMASPTMKINMEAINQPQIIPTGPAGIEKAKVEAIEGSNPIMEKAIPNTSIIVKLRRSSCLYPSLAVFV